MRWTSRRFLSMVVGVVTGVLVITGVIPVEQETGVSDQIVGLVALVLSIIGYQVTEASVDKARAGSGGGLPPK